MLNPKYYKVVLTGAPQPLNALALESKWLQVLAPSTNAADVLIGGAEVTTLVGFPIVKSQGQFMPGNTAEPFGFYQHNEINVCGTINDVLHVLYGG